jgi:hypothetical protein
MGRPLGSCEGWERFGRADSGAEGFWEAGSGVEVIGRIGQTYGRR